MVSAALLCFAAALVLYLYITHANLAPIVSWAASRSGQPVVIERAFLDKDYNLRIENLSLADAARIESIKIEWTLKSIFGSEVQSVNVDGGTFWLGRMMALSSNRPLEELADGEAISRQERSTSPECIDDIHDGRSASSNNKSARQMRLCKRSNSAKGKAAPTSRPTLFRKITLSRVKLILDNIGEGLPPVTLHMAQEPPFILLHDIRWGGATAGLEDEAMQTATISKFAIYSPYDPLSQVIAFDAIDIEFKWSQLLDQKLESICFRQPRIYLGPDLFWFTDEVAKQRAKLTAETTPSKPWAIKRVEVIGGRLIVCVHGQEAFPIPGDIAGEMDDVVVGDFNQLALKARFHTFIPELNYPEYQLKVKNVNASLDFNLPPAETSANNLVRTFEIEEIEWKGLRFGESKKNPAWVSLTVDKTGLYSTFGAPGLSGYLNGGLAIYLDEKIPWVAWGSVTSVDIAPPTRLLASEYVALQGKVKGTIQVRGHGKEVNMFETKVDCNTPGRLEIYAAKDLIEKLPESWSQMKQQLAKASIESFQTFDYENGLCEIAYTPPESYLTLQLRGGSQERNFHLRWKDLRPVSQSFILPVE